MTCINDVRHMSNTSAVLLGIIVAALSSGCVVAVEEDEDIGSISNAIKGSGQGQGTDDAFHAAAEEARETRKAVHDMEKAARLREGFEGYQVPSAPSQFAWFAKGKSYYTITNQEAGSGKQSLGLVSVTDSAYPDNRIGAKVCAPIGSQTSLDVQFKMWMNEPASAASWGFIGISNNPQLAAAWWIRPDGTITNYVDVFGKIEWNTWNDIRIVVDLAGDLATFTLNGASVSTPISTVWGLIARPIECLRLTAASQTMLVDHVDIRPEFLDLPSQTH